MVGQGSVTTGTVVLILTILTRVGYAFTHIGNMLNGFIRLYGESEEGLNSILIDHEIVDEPHAKDLVNVHGTITFANTTFAYDQQIIFNNLNLDIKPGERIGLVGPSGAGKSTLVSLLLRQHDLTSGAILIDNQNIAEVTQDSLRSNIALVPQEPMLFHRTIKENIMYGKPDATHEEMVQAADRAQAREFIEALPEQYDTLVGERGVKLSGGQKQRVAIARAMLKEAPILVLDEATSALDSESEVAIQKALESLMENKTVIAVAHRLSTLRKMDRILVIDQGKIVEDGTHDSLANAGGLYAKLWEHQAGGFVGE
jgi:ATP-binding cassette subfamily B multidrug efflux pump